MLSCYGRENLLLYRPSGNPAQGFTRFEAGGALGFDTLAENIVLRIKEEFPHVRLVLALPCPQQANSWQPKDVALYENILNRSDYYFYVSQSYHRGCMQQRNRRLVDDSELCVAYCTQATGGTAYQPGRYPLKFAKKSIHVPFWERGCFFFCLD